MSSATEMATKFRSAPFQPRVVALCATALVVVCILAWNASTTASMISTWHRSETYAHGFVVVPIVLWLIWRDRARLAATPIQPTALPLAALAFAGFGWLVAELASVLGGAQFLLVAMIPLAVWSILGTAMARALAFPLAFLFFAVPFGDFVVPVLMDWTADFTVMALRATGVPVLREGRSFAIPSGNWSVVEACSGVRYLIASMVVGTLYAYLTYRTLSRRLGFVLAAMVVPLVANWLRAYMIVMIGHLSGNRLAVGVDHIIYGWVFFGVVMALLFWLAPYYLREPPKPAEADNVRSVEASDGATAGVTRVVIAAIAVGAVVLPWRPLLSHLESRTATSAITLAPILAVAGWEHGNSRMPPFRPEFANPVAESTQYFARNGEVVGVFVAYYRDQTQARELVSQGNRVVTTANPDWTHVREGVASAQSGSRVLQVREVELRHSHLRLDAWQWYWIGGRTSTSDFVAKAWLAWSRLMGQGDDSAAVVIYSPRTDPSVSVAPVLGRFVADMGDSIHEALQEARR